MPNKPIQFNGFERPETNFFRLPNSWTDITAEMTSLAEVKVVEYVLRHTWGFQEFDIAKRISTDEFMLGRCRADGSRMDNGTGLSNKSVIDGVKRAVEHGYLVEHVDDADKGRVKKSYALRMKHLQADVKNLHRGVKNLDTRGEESRHRTEKETKERNTVNGSIKTTNSPFRQLPDLGLEVGEIEVLVEEILGQLDDEHSRDLHRLIAAKIPGDVIREGLGQLKLGGAKTPAAAFTARMKDYATARLIHLQKKEIGESPIKA